jgi:hypothetical protein
MEIKTQIEAIAWAKEAEKKRLANPTKCNKPEHRGICYD